jgi:hypothetical protein
MDDSGQKAKNGPGLGAVIIPLVTFVVGFAAGHLVSDIGVAVKRPKVQPSTGGAHSDRDARDGVREPQDLPTPSDEELPEPDATPETGSEDPTGN